MTPVPEETPLTAPAFEISVQVQPAVQPAPKQTPKNRQPKKTHTTMPHAPEPDETPHTADDDTKDVS